MAPRQGRHPEPSRAHQLLEPGTSCTTASVPKARSRAMAGRTSCHRASRSALRRPQDVAGPASLIWRPSSADPPSRHRPGPLWGVPNSDRRASEPSGRLCLFAVNTSYPQTTSTRLSPGPMPFWRMQWAIYPTTACSIVRQRVCPGMRHPPPFGPPLFHGAYAGGVDYKIGRPSPLEALGSHHRRGTGANRVE